MEYQPKRFRLGWPIQYFRNAANANDSGGQFPRCWTVHAKRSGVYFFGRRCRQGDDYHLCLFGAGFELKRPAATEAEPHAVSRLATANAVELSDFAAPRPGSWI